MRSIAATVLGLALITGGSAAVLSPVPAVAAAPEVSKGKITAINEDNSSFTVTTENDEEVTVTFDNKTVWMLGEEVSTRDAVLKKDNEVSVTHSNGVAARVEAKKKDPA